MMTDSSRKKYLLLALFWGAQVITEAIRVSLSVVAPTLMKTYSISPSSMGFVLSGWNWGYTGFLLLVGPLVDRFGSWIVMGVGAGVWSLATLALPAVAASGPSIFAMRAVFGVGHSVRHCAQAASISRWFRVDQVASAIGVCFSGVMVGLATGTTVAAFVLVRWGWQAVFYCVGGASLLYAVLWFVLYPDKSIGRREVKRTTEGAAISPFQLLRYRAAWGIALGQMGYLYAHFFFVNWLPGYLIIERKMTVLKTGIVASLPFWLGLLGTVVGGLVGDYLIKRGFSRTASRKTLIGTGLTMATILVVSAALTSSVWLSVTFLTLCMGFMRITTASLNSAPIDLAPPELVGSLTALQNFVGTISGLLAAIVTGYIVQSTGSFIWALFLAGAMALMGAISYVFIVRRYEPLDMGPGSKSLLVGESELSAMTRAPL